jgi:hypothetical protein
VFLVHPTPAIYLWLDSSYLFDRQKLPDDYPFEERCLLISVKARTGYDLEFQVLTERGMLRDKLPIVALAEKKFSEQPDFLLQEELQRWSCPAQYVTILCLPLQTGKVWINGISRPFKYLFTVDFTSGFELDPGSDVDMPEEHKAQHIIVVDNGQLAAMPNNSLVWDHPTLVSKDMQLKENPGYKVQSKDYSVERYRLAKPQISKNESFYDTV